MAPINAAANNHPLRLPHQLHLRVEGGYQLHRWQKLSFAGQQLGEARMSNARSYLLDTANGTIRTVMLPTRNRTKYIHEFIGSSMVDVVRIQDSHLIYADNKRLTDGLPSVTDLKGHPSPLAGNLLIVGNDENSEAASVSASIDDVASWFTIIRPVFLPVFETVRGSQTVDIRVIRLDVRIERSAPNVIG